MWFGVTPRTETKKTMCNLERIELHAQVGKKVTTTHPYMYLTLYAEYRTHARSPTFSACGDLLPNHVAIINRTFHCFPHPFDRQKTTQKSIKKTKQDGIARCWMHMLLLTFA